MRRKYIIILDDTLKGWKEDIDELERKYGAEELEQEPNCPFYDIDEDGHGVCRNHRYMENTCEDAKQKQQAKKDLACDNAISRKAAIDALTEEAECEPWDYSPNDAIATIKALPSVNPKINDQWQELKETITEMRDNDGTGTQQKVCKFLANYMNVLEKEMSVTQKPGKSGED